MFSTSNSIYSTKMVSRPTIATKTKKENLARAQQICIEAKHTPPESSSSDTNATENGEANDESSGDDIECTGWNGSVVHYVSSDDKLIVISDGDSEGEEEVEELLGSKLEKVLQKHIETPEAILQLSAETNGYSTIMQKQTKNDWKKVESCQGHSHPKLSVAQGAGSKPSADKIQPTARRYPTMGDTPVWFPGH